MSQQPFDALHPRQVSHATHAPCSITQIIISDSLMYLLGVGGPQREISVACQITQRNASQQHRFRRPRVGFYLLSY
jgi:hypothetical protein